MSFASPPKRRKFCSVARARNYHWINWFTYEEYALARAWRRGATCFDPSQHYLVQHCLSCFTWYCQWDRNMIALSLVGWRMSCFLSPATHSSHVSMFLSFLQVNLPRSACSAGGIAYEVIKLIIIWITSVGILSSEKSRPEQRAAIACIVTISRSGASLSHTSSRSMSSSSWKERAWQYQTWLWHEHGCQ